MKRRSNSEGSVYERKDGRWEGKITLPDGSRKSFYGSTKNEVVKTIRARQRDIDRGLPALDETVTVGAYLDQWLEEVARPSVRPSTYESYESHVRRHLKPALGRIRLTELTPLDVQRLVNRKVADGLSPATVALIRATLRGALNQALKWEMVHRNVAAKGQVKTPTIERDELQPLSVEQIRVLLSVVGGDRLEALYIMAIALGLRQGELLGLWWSDIDWDAAKVSVKRTLRRVNGAGVYQPPKTKRSRRTIDLPPFVVAALRRHKAVQAEERLGSGGSWVDPRIVFASSVGTPLDASNVTHRLQELLLEAGLPRQRFHDLRHACASLLFEQGASAREVMELLGHSQIGLTMNTYTHLMPGHRRRTADRMEALLG